MNDFEVVCDTVASFPEVVLFIGLMEKILSFIVITTNVSSVATNAATVVFILVGWEAGVGVSLAVS